MEKPTDLKIWLYESWPIHTLEVDYVQNGVDTAETRVTITGRIGKKTLKWETVKPLLDVRVDYNSAAALKCSFSDEVKKWKAFEKEHAKDLAELARLKKKLGQG